MLGLINRPNSIQRDTLQNILETKEYSLNYIRYTEYWKAHQTSARCDKNISEFEQVGFEELYYPFCKAQFVKDAIVKVAMKLEEIIPIPINGTLMIVGSIIRMRQWSEQMALLHYLRQIY